MRVRAAVVLSCLASVAAMGPVVPVPPAPASPAAAPVAAPKVDPCGPPVRKADGTRWRCSFADDFDGAALDPQRWLAQDTSVTGITAGGTGCFVNGRSVIRVARGLLRLSARHLASPVVCHSPYGDFTTDRTISTVTTKGRFAQAFGRFSVRAKMARTTVAGAHSAVWLYPDRHTYGPWPASGEIDIAEWYSALPRHVFPSVHYLDGHRDVHTSRKGRVPHASRFHTYTLEWSPTSLRFSYDGTLVDEHHWTPAAPLSGAQPFDQPFNLVLSQMWGGLWNAPGADTPDRVTMKVDWVKVWH